MDIPTKEPPIACRPYPIPLKYQEFVNGEIKLLEETGCISKSISPWAAPIITVHKKSDPNQPNKPLFQMVLHYRKLNKAINSTHNSDKTVSYYPLPNISDLLAKLGNCKLFSSLDLHSGYHHIRIRSEARPKNSIYYNEWKMALQHRTFWHLSPTQNIFIPYVRSSL